MTIVVKTTVKINFTPIMYSGTVPDDLYMSSHLTFIIVVLLFLENKQNKLLRPREVPGGSVSKESACSAGDLIQSLGWEDPLEKEMATYSSSLAWEIPWTEEPGGLLSLETQRVRHN